MSTLELLLLAVSLAMDCFTVSIASGILLHRIQGRTFLTMAFFFGLFQGLMPLGGWLVASRFSHLIVAYDHWIAFALLVFLGGRMIHEGWHSEGPASFDPTRLKVVLTLAVATSIDALAVGITFAFTGMQTLQEVLMPAGVVGITSFLFSLLGSCIGVYCGRRFRLRVEVWGGLILILIGTKILVEHLFLS